MVPVTIIGDLQLKMNNMTYEPDPRETIQDHEAAIAHWAFKHPDENHITSIEPLYDAAKEKGEVTNILEEEVRDQSEGVSEGA